MKTQVEVFRGAEEYLKSMREMVFTAEEILAPLPAVIGYNIAVDTLEYHRRLHQKQPPENTPQAVQEKALGRILIERARQDAKWGEQNHAPMEWLAVLGEEYGEACQAALRHHFGKRSLFEFEEETAHVAAVALAILECLCRNDWSSWAEEKE